jgi:chromosomal replication initiator protein
MQALSDYQARRARLGFAPPRAVVARPAPVIVSEAPTPIKAPVVVMDDSEYLSPKAKTTFATIAREVTTKRNVRWIDIVSARRTRNLLIPRFEVMWRARHETLMSLPQIGRQMGRDHTTILYGVRKYQAMIDAGTIEP